MLVCVHVYEYILYIYILKEIVKKIVQIELCS